VFVFFGGETLENPDARADLAIVPDSGNTTFAGYEAIETSIFISADGSVRGLLAYSGQDDEGGTRVNYASFYPAVGRGLGAREHSGDGVGRNVGGNAPDSGGVLAIERDTVASLPARQVLFGDGNGSMFSLPAPLDAKHPVEEVGYAFPDTEYMSETFALPPSGPSEDLLVICEGAAFRTHGDVDPTTKAFPLGATATLAGSGHRFARGRVVGDTYYAVASTQFGSDIPVVAVTGDGDPVASSLGTTAAPDDLAIADVGGNSAIDVVAIESGTVGVYEDLALGTPSMPAATFGSRDALAGYDLLAVGNFHGDARLEIYALSTLHPEQPLRCFHVDGDAMAPCDGE